VSLLKAKELAKMLDVSIAKVRRLAKDGVIPSVMIGKMRRYNQSDVARFLNEQKQKTQV